MFLYQGFSTRGEFQEKLENWITKVNMKNVAMFEKLSSVLVVGGEDH